MKYVTALIVIAWVLFLGSITVDLNGSLPPVAAQTYKRYSSPPPQWQCQEWQRWLDQGYAMRYDYGNSWWILPSGILMNSITKYECLELYPNDWRLPINQRRVK